MDSHYKWAIQKVYNIPCSISLYHKFYNVAPELVIGLLWESEKYLHKQQTPNPDAHVPEAVPPNFEQSDEL